jgi:hypothetical protein
MPNQDRCSQLKERLANTRLAGRTGAIENILRGKEPLRAGMAVEVERAANRAAPNGESYHVRIAASTETIARDGGIVPMRAWERGGLKNFSANPIILAFHDHKSPIGISVFTEIDHGNLIEYWRFHQETDLSKTMKKLYEDGYMRAASVGFLVHEFKFIDELSEDEVESLYKQYGKSALSDVYWIAEKAELLETSAVPVPADPNALAFKSAARNAEAHGVDVADLLRLSRGESMSTKAESVTATVTEKNTEAVAATAADPIGELRTFMAAEFEKLRNELKVVSDKVETIEKSAGSTSAAVTETSDAARSADAQVEIEIEKLDGESDEQARTRYIETLVRQKLGMPIPAKK